MVSHARWVPIRLISTTTMGGGVIASSMFDEGASNQDVSMVVELVSGRRMRVGYRPS